MCSSGTSLNAISNSISAYASYNVAGNYFLDALLGYSKGTLANHRYVSQEGNVFPSDRNFNTLFASIVMTGEFRTEHFLFAPNFRSVGIWSVLDPYMESVNSPWALTYDQLYANQYSVAGGLRTAFDIVSEWGLFTPTLRLEFGNTFASSQIQALTYADGLSPTYYVRMENGRQSYGLVGLGIRGKLLTNTEFDFEYSTYSTFNGLAAGQTFSARIASSF